MKEKILSCLYEIIKPWACNVSNSAVYVHKNNVRYVREYLNKNGFKEVKVKMMKNFPYI